MFSFIAVLLKSSLQNLSFKILIYIRYLSLPSVIFTLDYSHIQYPLKWTSFLQFVIPSFHFTTDQFIVIKFEFPVLLWSHE